MDKPIRILHVVQRMEAGGTQALLMNIYRNIDRNKIQFDFLVEYPEKEFYDDEILAMGGNIYYTDVRKNLNIIKFKKELTKILEGKYKYQIIHVHVSTIGYLCFSIAKKFGIKVRIAHAHNNSSVKDIKYILRSVLRKLFAYKATDYFACSEEAGKFFFKHRKFKCIKNAIDSSKFIFDDNIRNKKRKELQLQENFVIGHVGRLHPQKNHKFLIEIFAKIKEKKKNAKLILVGNGPQENEIKNIVKTLNLEKDVLFLGTRKDVNEIYQAMDIFIFPSLFEGLGIAAIEAQASGIPVLCSDTVSKQVEITNICKRISLQESALNWANEAIQLSQSKDSKKNMQKEIIDSGFDIKHVSEELQEFYISKYEEILNGERNEV